MDVFAEGMTLATRSSLKEQQSLFCPAFRGVSEPSPHSKPICPIAKVDVAPFKRAVASSIRINRYR